MASRELLIEQIPHLRRYARVLVGYGRADEADDLVQDTLERACAKWHLWQSHRSLRPWLFSIMHNLFVDQRMAVSGSLEQSLDEMAEPKVAAGQEARLEAISLIQSVQNLPLPLREVLLLVCIEGLGYREAAQTLGIPMGTVMSRLSRARAQLLHCTEGKTAAGRTSLQVVGRKTP
ncbi:MAG: sigma-70 family RNA polymerase sigma factor [Betaproteobacteria bacterium]|nr:sigma-70 family RNA polymerase sigma factor [Betaproteobacteria bacterium]